MSRGAEPAQMRRRDARRFLECLWPGVNRARELSRLLIGTRIEGETHLVSSPSFLPYLPNPSYSPPFKPFNPPAFQGGSMGAWWKPLVQASADVLQESAPEADSEDVRMLRGRQGCFPGMTVDCWFLGFLGLPANTCPAPCGCSVNINGPGFSQN